MKRRSILKSALGAPVAATALAQTPSSSGEQFPKLALTGAEAVADAHRRFFTAVQLATLRKLGELIVPGGPGRVSATEAGAADFLDFLTGESPASAKALYRDGLDQLDLLARSKFQSAFAALDAARASQLLEPLRAPWTYSGPPDTLGQFLQQVKSDLLQATMSSREAAEAASRGRRGAGGMTNYYWRAVD